MAGTWASSAAASGGLRQLAGGFGDRGQLGEAPAGLSRLDLVGVDRRVGQPQLKLGVLGQQLIEAIGAHVTGSHT
jgi:hypothetical protein